MSYQIEVSQSLINRFVRNYPQYETALKTALKEIAENPFVDGEIKFVYNRPPILATLYANNGIKIIYGKEIVGGKLIFRISYILV